MPQSSESSSLLQRGLDALRQRKFDMAAELLTRHLDAAPNDSAAELALAKVRSCQGKHGAALVILDRLADGNPNSATIPYNRGAVLERLGRLTEAAKAYETTLRVEPSHADARSRLAVL